MLLPLPKAKPLMNTLPPVSNAVALVATTSPLVAAPGGRGRFWKIKLKLTPLPEAPRLTVIGLSPLAFVTYPTSVEKPKNRAIVREPIPPDDDESISTLKTKSKQPVQVIPKGSTNTKSCHVPVRVPPPMLKVPVRLPRSGGGAESVKTSGSM